MPPNEYRYANLDCTLFGTIYVESLIFTSEEINTEKETNIRNQLLLQAFRVKITT